MIYKKKGNWIDIFSLSLSLSFSLSQNALSYFNVLYQHRVQAVYLYIDCTSIVYYYIRVHYKLNYINLSFYTFCFLCHMINETNIAKVYNSLVKIINL